jgi:DNA-binding HxlR family transcriptional regulator
MVRTSREGEPCCVCPCPCDGLIDIIGKKWTLCVLAQLGNQGILRFNELQQNLSGISAKTLSDVLKDLRLNGIIRRQAFNEIPPRVEYHLTREGRELTMLVAPLMIWADKQSNLIQIEK